MALGRYVLLARDVPRDGSSQLVAHELIHVRQWAELGVVGFLVGYLGSFFRELRTERSWDAAYRRIPAEQEAYRLADRWAADRARPGGAPPADDVQP
jgi:hypothetical protein